MRSFIRLWTAAPGTLLLEDAVAGSFKKLDGTCPMRAPQPWPCSSETDWRLWRSHLDHAQMPHVATLKREADAEITRIVRCRYGGREPKRPAAVPPQRLPLADASMMR